MESKCVEGYMGDQFVQEVINADAPTTVFLTNGVKLQGKLGSHDDMSITLHNNGESQLVYKHAIATILPQMKMDVNGNR